MNTNTKSNQHLLVDMIAFTFSIPERNRMEIVNIVNNKVFQVLYQCVPLRKSKNRRGRYNNDYQLKFIKDTRVKLSMYPINKGHRFIRVEFNPNKLGTVGRIVLRRMLIELLGRKTVLHLYFEAVVTRLDLALDILDMEQRLYVHRERVRCSEIIRDSGTGEILSQIVGSQASNVRITVYDKNAEQGTTKSEKNYQRIEVNYKHMGCNMEELLPSLVNIFMEMNFFRDDFLNDQRMSKSFRNRVYSNGLNLALYKLFPATRKQYMEYLEDYRADPVDEKALNFELAHYRALKFLVHPKFRKPHVKQKKSLINNTLSP